jgi:hypothetical protein
MSFEYFSPSLFLFVYFLSIAVFSFSLVGHYYDISSGPLHPLGRIGTVPKAYEPFKAHNISLEKKKIPK